MSPNSPSRSVGVDGEAQDGGRELTYFTLPGKVAALPARALNSAIMPAARRLQRVLIIQFAGRIPGLLRVEDSFMEKKTTSPRSMAVGICTFLLLVTGAAAQSYSILTSFNGSDGQYPQGSILLDRSGNIFGVTQYGGTGNTGVVYELVNEGGGRYFNRTLYNFACGTDGGYPLGGLVADSSGNLYGATAGCGAHSVGVIYELARSGATYTERVIYTFTGGPDGAYPYADLAIDSQGRLDGTTVQGGGGGCRGGCGVLFQLVRNGGKWTERVLHQFKNNGVDGRYPDAGITLDSKGNIYGTTSAGGADQYGIVFRLSPDKTGYQETILHYFYGVNDGCTLYSGVALDSSSNLYGVTYGCGKYGYGTVYQFKRSGKKHVNNVVLQFNGSNGQLPMDSGGKVAVDYSGNVYGTATLGGAYGSGTVFKLTGGSFVYTDLHDFDPSNRTDGFYPEGGVSLDHAGSLYGTTQGAGSYGDYGTVWRITSP